MVYCSVECQKADWAKNNHKAVCHAGTPPAAFLAVVFPADHLVRPYELAVPRQGGAKP